MVTCLPFNNLDKDRNLYFLVRYVLSNVVCEDTESVKNEQCSLLLTLEVAIMLRCTYEKS